MTMSNNEIQDQVNKLVDLIRRHPADQTVEEIATDWIKSKDLDPHDAIRILTKVIEVFRK